jgi:hypothetical protein
MVTSPSYLVDAIFRARLLLPWSSMGAFLDAVPFSGIRDMMYSVANPYRLDLCTEFLYVPPGRRHHWDTWDTGTPRL